MAPETMLTWLSVTGVAVGFMGAVISQVTRTSVDVEGTAKKRLTPSGRWALAISIIGFVGSFSSEMFKAYIAAQLRAQSALDSKSRQERNKEEERWRTRSAALEAAILRNTNNALAQEEKNLESTIDTRQRLLADNLTRETRLYGRLSATTAPLTRLLVRITIDDVPEEILSHARAGIRASIYDVAPDFKEWLERHEIDEEDEATLVRSVMDQKAIQPTVNLLANGKFTQQPAVLLLGLDERDSAIIGLGWVPGPDVVKMQGGTTFLPSGILIGKEIEWRRSYEHLETSYRRLRHLKPKVDLAVKGHALVLSLDLDLTSIDDTILRCSPNAAKTAALSDRVELMTWSPWVDDDPPSTLPLEAGGIHSSVLDMDKSYTPHPRPAAQPAWMRSIRVQVTPNDVPQIAKTYILSFSSAGSPVEGSRGDNSTGYVRVWHGRATN